jgi:hypothetical protein
MSRTTEGRIPGQQPSVVVTGGSNHYETSPDRCGHRIFRAPDRTPDDFVEQEIVSLVFPGKFEGETP